jgi:hypothetical protein
MAKFGFPGAVTTLGHHGTGLTNFQISVPEECTLEEICSKLEQVLAGITLILNSSNTNQSILVNNTHSIAALLQQAQISEDRFKIILSVINDLRRELLRGNRDIRR